MTVSLVCPIFLSLILSLLVTALSLVFPVFLFFVSVSIDDGSFSCLPYLSFLWSCLYWWRLFLLSVSFLWSCLYLWRLFILSALSFFSLILSLFVTALSFVFPIFLFFNSCLYWWRPFLLSAQSFFSLILSLLVTALSLVFPIFLFFDPVSTGDGPFSCLPYLSFLWSCLYWWRLFLLSTLSFFSLILSLLVMAFSLVSPIFLFFDPVSIGDGSFSCLSLFFDPVSIYDGFFSCQPYLSFLWSCLYWWQLFLLFALSFFSLILSLLVTAFSLVCLFSLILSLFMTALYLVCPIFLFFDPVSICDGSFFCLPYLSFL